jgi:hypothetical protein
MHQSSIIRLERTEPHNITHTTGSDKLFELSTVSILQKAQTGIMYVAVNFN